MYWLAFMEDYCEYSLKAFAEFFLKYVPFSLLVERWKNTRYYSNDPTSETLVA